MSEPFNLSPTILANIQSHLNALYPTQSSSVFTDLLVLLADFAPRLPKHAANTQNLSEKDVILITYGDQIQSPGEATLQTLSETLEAHLKGILNSVHILPFYPYSSDDGFSVTDYTTVNPAMGNWTHIAALRSNFRLMFDAVINHISVQSEWFQGFLRGDDHYTDFFITVDPETDLSSITRPRTHPLLTPFDTAHGKKYVWTTFSADQADLNYKNPKVLLAIIEVLLTYVEHGAEFIRLDAIGYLWKEIGTSCIHLPQVHRVIQLFRSIFDALAPQVILITETNVPHVENISYFGNGFNEAQMVYNFSLPPLILHTLHTGDATTLSRWANTLKTPSKQTTYFNFTASHDGIGILPAKGILSEDEIDALVQKTVAHGGLVSHKTNPDGTQSPYELNITFFDALSAPHSDETQSMKVARFIVSQAIMLAIAGVPGIYGHSLVGAHNNLIGLAETGRARTINREKWLRGEFESALANPNTIASQVFKQYTHLLKIRANHFAFHPFGKQSIIADNPSLFIVRRTASDGTEDVLCIHNVSSHMQSYPISSKTKSPLEDLSNGDIISETEITLQPYQVKWLRIL